MEFQLTDEQSEWQRVVRSALGQEDTRRTYFAAGALAPTQVWRLLGELGATALGTDPEAEGGASSVVEQMLVAEEIGRTTAPVPFATASAAHLLLAASPADSSRELLAEAVTTRLVVAALPGVGVPWPPLNAVGRGEHVELTGTLPLVPGGAWAETVLAPVGTGDVIRVVSISMGNAGVTVEPLRSLDPTTGLAALHLDAVISPVVLDDAAVAVAEANDLATLLIASEATGVADEALRMAAAYALDRHAFGHPIGSFQAIKHKLADMLISVENARSAVYGAAWAVHGRGRRSATSRSDASRSDNTVAVAMAKAVASASAVHVAAEALQIHGGIGCTFDADIHLYLRRAKSCALLFGDSTTHLERIAQHILDQDDARGVAL